MRTGTHRRSIALIVGLAACALLSAPGHAGAAKQRVIVKPKPGKQITHHPVRVVLRAGPEPRDLGVRLNGKKIGRQFLVKGRGRRTLDVSSTHGLRHGRNVLKVVARTHHGTRVRRSRVRFTVAHRRPLAGASADRRVVRGARIELPGRARQHPHGPRAKGVRWKLVDAPRRSRLLRRSPGKASAKKPRGLQAPASLTPTFRPDVHGTYTLKMTVGSGAGATTDRVSLDAVPPSPQVEVHTRIVSGSGANTRPAIQVGNKTYVAPFLSEQGGGTYSGDVDGVGFPDYQAMFQILVFDRSTLEFKSNQTYGVCKADPDRDDIFKTCVMDPKSGKPVISDLGGALEALGSNPAKPALVIVDSLPAASHDPASAEFVSDMVVKHAREDLSAIGYPHGTEVEPVTGSGSPMVDDQLANAPVDSLSVIGGPSLKPGEADWAIIPEAVAPLGRGMNGWLTPDQNLNYQFMPGARVPFDTRAKTDSCDASGCTVTATLGDETLTRKVDTGFATFLVAAYDPHTLERQDLDYFVTGGREDIQQANAAPRAAAMADFLKKWGNAGSLILISSVQTANPVPSYLADRSMPAGVWANLASEVAAVGGSFHKFNTAASTPNSDYTLIGFGGATQGEGEEAIGDKAQLRGVLVQDHESRYRPANVADEGAPSEFLTGVVVAPPGKEPWPLTGDPGAQMALSYIGAQYSQLTSDPRSAYWSNGIDATDATTLAGEVRNLEYPSPLAYYYATTHADEPPPPALPLKVPFSVADFGSAQRQLATELDYVSTVRDYLDKLAEPYGSAGAAAWGDAKTLADNLKNTLDTVKAKEERTLQIIELVASFLGFASLPWTGDAEVIEKILYAASASMEFGHDLVETNQDGSSAGDADDEREIAVDDVGQQLQDRMQHVSDSFKVIGDIIVSDWYKLELIGLHAKCDLPGGGCVCKLAEGCPPGLDQLAYSGNASTTVSDATAIALQRIAHETIVPYYFPIMDTGVSYCIGSDPCTSPPRENAGPDIHNFSCPLEPNPLNTDIPSNAYAGALEVFDPVGGRNRWRVFVAAAQPTAGGEWAWADKTILTRMFTEVQVGQLSADPPVGLGISAVEWMRGARADDPNPVGVATGCNWPEPF